MSKLLTTRIKELLKEYPLYSQDGKEMKRVIAIYRLPYSRMNWFATEGELQEDGDCLFFGYVRSILGEDCDEWGYFRLSDIESCGGILFSNAAIYHISFEGCLFNIFSTD